MIASIILNDMARTKEARYGYRSWMLQDIQEPYEVILNLFNDKRPDFQSLEKGCNSYCSKIIKVFSPNSFFNSSAANNIGFYFSSGKYIFFTNSDIIYPSNYLRTVLKDLSRRELCYSLGSRINLDINQTSSLLDPMQYNTADNFDFMIGFENLPERVMILGTSPWIILRSVAESIGGFNPQVLCNEDSEFNDRVMHYLRRTGEQDCLYAITDLYGYHLHHGPSELYNASAQAMPILEDQRKRFRTNPNSDEDALSTDLRSLDSLLDDFYKTKPPEAKSHFVMKHQITGKIRKIVSNIRS
jgi:hypothetical protein